MPTRKTPARHTPTGAGHEESVNRKARPAHERALRERGAGGSTGQRSKHDR